ncbi:putative RNA-binding protein [Leptomonas seymouri]|uniref:Putative RNA-binding protein n=1 Tax=Leptomonas seymouri TaxID=5684 RepID=A0A0N1PAT8_LEPSE|nr:putative RNA-binding protein [Leptomonas seymouri]|eukprot:KPI85870.1 putative RNA-binding protein [Leptomonas seymouri]
MDLAGWDLQNYQLARQLHLLSHLYEVFLTNAMCYPLFYESLHPSAKQHSRTILLVLDRVFTRSEHSGSTLFTRSPYRVHTVRCILSYLVYPDCVMPWPRCVSRLTGSLIPTAPQVVEVPSTPLHSGTVPSSLDATPLRLDATAEAAAQGHTPRTSTDPSLTPAQPSPLQHPLPAPPPRPLSPAATNTTGASLPATAADIMTHPFFYVRPLNAPAADRSAPYFGVTTHIYVRMVHPHLLNEESLNPYFGRYGQVDCTPIQRTPLQQYAIHLGGAATEALHQLFAASNTSDSSSLYVQDFIISVDSHQNAVHAVRRAYYKELVCIALHDPTGSQNTHCLADVNGWMRRHAFVWRLRAEVPISNTEKEMADDAATGKRRKRMRVKQRLRERKRKRRAVLHEGDSSTSSSASSSTSESDADKDGGSSSSESSSPSSTSSSDSSSGEDDLMPFVPDVVLDGFPYWTTEDQLKVLLQEYGTVAELRLSLDDLSGAFTGCVLVRMSTLEEAIHVSRTLHDTLYRGYRLVSGVINEKLEVVALEDGEEVRIPAIPEQVPHDVSLNERVWV